jgi:hypothetical protein
LLADRADNAVPLGLVTVVTVVSAALAVTAYARHTAQTAPRRCPRPAKDL